jgi:uncharacterized protein GlcG (DUF336 family)
MIRAKEETERRNGARRLGITAVAFAVFCSNCPSASGQVSKIGYVLPVELALDAANEALSVCSTKGYDVTATVVDVAGTPQVVLRGDHAAIHTKDSAFRKAYTIVTMGPIFHLEVTSQFLALLEKYPPLAAQSLASTPNVSALPGGAAIIVRGEIVAGLGVGGSPGGDKDEDCAKAGVVKIQGRLPR